MGRTGARGGARAARYLWAWDVDRADWRSFRLDRMDATTLSEWEFKPRPDLAEGLARLDAPMPWDAHAHRVVLRVRATVDAVGHHLPTSYGETVDLADGWVRHTTGVDDPAEAAAWLAWLPFEFVVEGDQAIVDAVAALAQRLTRAVVRDT